MSGLAVQSCGNNALLRALRDGHTYTSDPLEADGTVLTWWGAMLTIRAGDRLRYFPTPWGFVCEAVVAGSENHSESG